MEKSEEKYDKFFLTIVIILTLVGFLVFISASMKFIALEGNADLFIRKLGTQAGLGLFGGLIAGLLVYKLPVSFWKLISPYAFLVTLFLLILVLIFGTDSRGAVRWLEIAGMSLQPVEIHKITTIMFLSAWYAQVKNKVKSIKFGLVPFLTVIGITSLVLLLHPDMGSIMVIGFSALIVYFVAGARLKHLVFLFGLMVVLSTILYATVDYVHNRIDIYFNFVPTPIDEANLVNVSKVNRIHAKVDNFLGYSFKRDNFQNEQAIKALSAGGIYGEGYLSGTNKLTNLPKPENDAIFAVVGEEFGFTGSVIVLVLFLLFLLRGIRIANRTQDNFSRLLVIGLVILIVAQVFLNIGAMLRVLPLTGIPLIFFSQGGSALFFALTSVAMILKVSKYQKEPKKKVMKTKNI